MLLISTIFNIANCTPFAASTKLCSIDTFRLHPDYGSIYSGSMLMTLRRVDSIGPAMQLYALCSDDFHTFRLAFICPALATRSGVAPRIGIYSPDIGNTLGGCASH
jgi:hypothetical protein